MRNEIITGNGIMKKDIITGKGVIKTTYLLQVKEL